jgi:hypothetical protein
MLGTTERLHKLWPLERYSAPQSELVRRAIVLDADLIRDSVRFEVFTAVTMTDSVFWAVTPCGFC